jgi:hypothetical protein
MRKRLSLLAIIPIIVIVAYLFYIKAIEMTSFYTQLAVALLCFIPVIVIFAFQPEISKWIRKGKDEEKIDLPKQNHSRDLSHTFTIMSKGKFEAYGKDRIEFLIPYPFEEYSKYVRHIEYPTPREVLDLFNKPKEDPFARYSYTFVPLTKSQEGKFDQAMLHLKSYDEINSKFELAKKERENFSKFLRNNEKEIIQMFKKIGKEEDIESEPIYIPYNEESKKLSNATKELQDSLEILAQNLTDGKIIKGECKGCP